MKNQKAAELLRDVVSESILEVCKLLKTSVKAYARKCGLPESTVENYVAKRTLPDLERLGALLRGAEPHAAVILSALGWGRDFGKFPLDSTKFADNIGGTEQTAKGWKGRGGGRPPTRKR